MGRVTIAEQAVEAHTDWRHLALEVLAESALPEDTESQGHLMIIKQCVDALEKDGLHLILTMPADAIQRDILAEGLQPNCITVHLGSNNDGEYDFVIDPSTRSVKDVTKFLHTIMESDETEGEQNDE